MPTLAPHDGDRAPGLDAARMPVTQDLFATLPDRIVPTRQDMLAELAEESFALSEARPTARRGAASGRVNGTPAAMAA
jgi:hypothetical protein